MSNNNKSSSSSYQIFLIRIDQFLFKILMIFSSTLLLFSTNFLFMLFIFLVDLSIPPFLPLSTHTTTTTSTTATGASATNFILNDHHLHKNGSNNNDPSSLSSSSTSATTTSPTSSSISASSSLLLSSSILTSSSYSLLLSSSSSKPTSMMLVNGEHRAGSYRRSQIQALYRAPCSTQNDCRFDNTLCNLSTKKCQCKNDYVQVDSFVNRSYITHLAMTCLPVARIDERCISDMQCIVDFSECKLTTEKFGQNNRTIHMCKCSNGHELKDDQTTVILNGHSYRIRPICDPERSNSSSWIATIIFITILVLVILIGTFVLIVRYQRLRQPYNQSTITSLTNQSGPGGQGGGPGGINSHPMGHHQGSSSPPPMGSVEAEFQNDFIQVFPMHHLEPMPDKNAHAFIIK